MRKACMDVEGMLSAQPALLPALVAGQIVAGRHPAPTLVGGTVLQSTAQIAANGVQEAAPVPITVSPESSPNGAHLLRGRLLIVA